MLELLKQISPKFGEKREYVFSVDGERPYAGQRRLKQILDREIKTSLENASDNNQTEFEEWVFHDLRRTLASGLAQLRAPEEVIKRVLNHAPSGVVAVYNRHEYLEEKRAALEAWSSYVHGIVDDAKPASNVEQLRPAVSIR